MQKSILVLLVVVVAAGVAIFFVQNGGEELLVEDSESSQELGNDTVSDDSDTDPAVSSNISDNEHLKGANIGDSVDATDQPSVNVEIDDFIYKTTRLTVSKGTTVIWTNVGRVQHDVTSTTNSPKQGLSSDLMRNGESYSFKFDEIGTYQYFCSPHPTQMRAVVEVVE